MKIILFSDWHIGLTSPGAIRKQLRKIAAEAPDLLINCGDNCGGNNGARATNTINKFVREFLPDVPYISTLGNHDYWLPPREQTEAGFHKAYGKIVDSMRAHRVHFLDVQGPFRLAGRTFVGHTLWYGATQPNTNDICWSPPIVDGQFIHDYLRARAWRELDRNLRQLLATDTDVSFVSHFPVVEMKEKEHGHGGPPQIERLLEGQVSRYFNGHFHQRHEGPYRYECGADYGSPNYLVVNL